MSRIRERPAQQHQRRVVPRQVEYVLDRREAQGRRRAEDHPVERLVEFFASISVEIDDQQFEQLFNGADHEEERKNVRALCSPEKVYEQRLADKVQDQGRDRRQRPESEGYAQHAPRRTLVTAAAGEIPQPQGARQQRQQRHDYDLCEPRHLGLRIADCGLRISDYRSPYCGLRISDYRSPSLVLPPRLFPRAVLIEETKMETS